MGGRVMPVDAVWVVEGIDVIRAFLDEVVVRQVDGRPGYEQVEEQQEIVLVVGHEVPGPDDRQQYRGREDDGDQDSAQDRAGGNRPPRAERRHEREHPAIQVHGVDSDDAESDGQQDDHPGRAANHCIDPGNSAQLRVDGGHHAGHDHQPQSAQVRANKSGPERRRNPDIFPEVAGIVRYIWCVTDLEYCDDRDREQERSSGEASWRPVEPAVHEESNCQYDEAGQESKCASPLPLVDQVITENRQDQRGDTQDDYAGVKTQAMEDRAQPLCGGYDTCCKEADVQDNAEDNRQYSSIETELAAALDELRHPKTRALRRVERHENSAYQVADHYRDHSPEKVIAH